MLSARALLRLCLRLHLLAIPARRSCLLWLLCLLQDQQKVEVEVESLVATAAPACRPANE